MATVDDRRPLVEDRAFAGYQDGEDPWTTHWRWTAIGHAILIDNLERLHRRELDGGGVPTGTCKCGLPAPCPTAEAIGAYRARESRPCTCWRSSGGECLQTPADEAEPKRDGHGPGVPGAMHLEGFGQSIADAFGECPYHVGSSATSKTWRDVDVRLILDDDKFDALFPGFATAHHIDAWWSLLCAALSELGRARTGLPVDFQIQSMTEANEKYPSGIRSPLFLIRADENQPRMVP